MGLTLYTEGGGHSHVFMELVLYTGGGHSHVFTLHWSPLNSIICGGGRVHILLVIQVGVIIAHFGYIVYHEMVTLK